MLWPTTRNTIFLAITVTLLGSLLSCEGPTRERHGIAAVVRGLNTNESVTLTNGSTLVVDGTSDLSWGEPSYFGKDYSVDTDSYSVSIAKQPENSNKICRILNPTGAATFANTIIRVQCGFTLTIGDVNATTTGNSGLVVSNGLQTLSVNSGTQNLVTALTHTFSDETLTITPTTTPRSASFKELYLPGDPVVLTLSSTNQGCQITGNTNNSNYESTYPEETTLSQTLDNIAKGSDWIKDDETYGNSRSCSNFQTPKITVYSPGENPNNDPSYSAQCFPSPPINVSCGLALRVTTNDLLANQQVTVTVTKSGTDTHALTFDNNTTRTFNLAFQGGDTYSILSSKVSLNGTVTVQSCTIQDQNSAVPGYTAFTSAADSIAHAFPASGTAPTTASALLDCNP